MRLLSLLLSPLLLLACGGATEPGSLAPISSIRASVPAPARQAITVTGASGIAVHMYQALYGMAPSNAMLLDYTGQATADASAFAQRLASDFNNASHPVLAKLVLDNLGVTAATVPATNVKGESEYAILLAAVQQIFAAYPTMRGQVILNMINLLTGLESDATYGFAAATYNVQASANFSYSSTPASEVSIIVTLPPPPTASIALSQARVHVGSSTTLSWSSSGANNCTGADSWSGTQPKSGSTSISHTLGGQYKYTLLCTGDGGAVTQSTTLIVPMKVFGTSYGNKNDIPFDATAVPTIRALGIPKTLSNEQDSVDRSIAFGDFFQEGKYSAFVMVGRFDNIYGTGWSDVPGIGYFLGQDAAGKWVDRSTQLFKTTADRMGCISPSFTAVADFNNDSKPDVYIACTGMDFAIPGATPDQNQAAGRSYQVLYLSQPDGSYSSKRVEEANPLYGHKAVALDINGDGNMDIITTDFIDPSQPNGCGAPYVLLGHGDGSFRRDYTFIDANFVRSQMPMCGFFDVDIIPIDGRYDIMIGGMTRAGENQGSWGVLWMNGRTGGFSSATARIMQMPVDTVTNTQYQFPLDIIYDSKAMGIYMKTTASGAYGTDWATIKFDKFGSLVGVIDSWLNTGLSQSPQFKPSSSASGYLEAYTGGCAADITQGDCGRKVKM